MGAERDLLDQIKRRAMLTLVTVVGFHLLLDAVYRPWQFKSDICDFGFAGSFTQITAVTGLAMLMILADARKNQVAANLKEQRYLYAIVPVLAMLCYEVLQIWYPIATFDSVDLIYCLVALFVSSMVIRFFVIP